jgi:S-DNA-T family DNA segregation ATPase FtsK/SpoIIIE
VVNEPEEAVGVFEELVREMERRYEVLSAGKVRNIVAYNELGGERMPYIVTVIDEMADLMMTAPKEMERCIVRLAQLSRAVGIHLILATQRPTSEVITGLIKANMPSRISYQVASKLDSRVILDCNGAEKLLGRGDLLMLYPGIGEPERYHGAWVSDQEIGAVTDSLKADR